MEEVIKKSELLGKDCKVNLEIKDITTKQQNKSYEKNKKVKIRLLIKSNLSRGRFKYKEKNNSKNRKK